MDTLNERPRLTSRHVAQGQTAQEALGVARADRAGLVDGVHVDFRHASIPPGEWEARAWWYVGHDSPQHCGFLFPKQAASLDSANFGDGPEPEAEKIRMLQALPRAMPGDRLTVESVVDQISDRRFDHRHDATVKLAYLVLTKPNGQTVRPDQPLTFYGVTQLRDAPQGSLRRSRRWRHQGL